MNKHQNQLDHYQNDITKDRRSHGKIISNNTDPLRPYIFIDQTDGGEIEYPFTNSDELDQLLANQLKIDTWIIDDQVIGLTIYKHVHVDYEVETFTSLNLLNQSLMRYDLGMQIIDRSRANSSESNRFVLKRSGWLTIQFQEYGSVEEFLEDLQQQEKQYRQFEMLFYSFSVIFIKKIQIII